MEYLSRSYSFFASIKIGMSASATFHRAGLAAVGAAAGAAEQADAAIADTAARRRQKRFNRVIGLQTPTGYGEGRFPKRLRPLAEAKIIGQSRPTVSRRD